MKRKKYGISCFSLVKNKSSLTKIKKLDAHEIIDILIKNGGLKGEDLILKTAHDTQPVSL